MFSKLSLFCVLLGVCFHVKAQDFDDYKPFQCSGEIPADFRGLFADKYQQSKQRIQKNSQTKKYEDAFLLKSNFKILQLMQSGKILFGDSSSAYVNQVADRLFVSNPEIRKKLRFYVVKSWYANAFATDEGIIVVSYGLLARLKTEAQLAFILAHESSHFIEKHAVTAYIEKEEAKADLKYWQRSSAEDFVMKRHAFSREQESEADMQGLKLFLRSGYSTDSLLNVFDILLHADLPFEERELNRTALNNEFLNIPPSLFGDTTTLPQRDEDYDDSESTHPNIATRKSDLQTAFETLGAVNVKGEEFLVSKEKFLKIREIARFEVATLYISSRQYERAIFHTLLLQEKYPNSKYLQKIRAQGLYGLARYELAGRANEVYLEGYIDGHLRVMPQLCDSISDAETLILSMTYIRSLQNKYPDDISLKMMLWDLTDEYEELYKGWVSDNPKGKTNKKLLSDEERDALLDSLNTKNKERRKQARDGKQTTTIIKAAFKAASDKLLADTIFQNQYLKEAEKGEIEWKTERKKFHKLGIDKILVINPFYLSFNYRAKEKLLYLTSEEKEIESYKRIRDIASMVNLETELLSAKELKSTDVDKFNDLTLLSNWMKENSQHEDLELVNFQRKALRKIAQKYGTQYIAWVGTFGVDGGTVELYHENTYVALGASVILPPVGIAMLYGMVKPKHHTASFVILYDLKQGQPRFVARKFLPYKDKEDILSASLYHIFSQIKMKDSDKED